EIPSNDEVKTPEQLQVALPEKNEDLHTLAEGMRKSLPRASRAPTDPDALQAWRDARRKQLTEVVRAKTYVAQYAGIGGEGIASTESPSMNTAMYGRMRLGDSWTLPIAELTRNEPKGTTIVIADEGRTKAVAEIDRLLDAGQRVIAVDPFYFGE